jgi:hypothetical protein
VSASPPPDASASLPESGDLAQHSPLRLYYLLAAAQVTGQLTLELADRTVQVHFKKGQPDAVESNHPDDGLGAYLVRERALTPEQVAQAEAAKAGFGGELLGALFGQGLLPPQLAFTHLSKRALELLARGLMAEAGRFQYAPLELPSQKALPLGDKWGVLSTVLRWVPAPELRRRLNAVLHQPVMKSGGRVDLSELRLTPQETRLVGRFDGVRPLGQLLQESPQDADGLLRLAILLRAVELITFVAPPAGAKPATPPGGSSRLPPPAPRAPPPSAGGAVPQRPPPVLSPNGAPAAGAAPAAPAAPAAGLRPPAPPPSGPAAAPASPAPRPAAPAAAPPRPAPAPAAAPQPAAAPVMRPAAPAPGPAAPAAAAPPPGAPAAPPGLQRPAAPQRPPPVVGAPAPGGAPAPSAPSARPAAPAGPPPVMHASGPGASHRSVPVGATPVPLAMPPEFVAEFASLQGFYKELKGQNHFQRLGVPEAADGGAVKMAYFKLARVHHPDMVPPGAPPEMAKLKADIFALIGEAYRTLGEDASRAEYIQELKTGSGEVDVLNLLKAEDLFNRGMALVKARRFPEALKVLEEAVSLNPDEGEFYAWRGYAKFYVAGDKQAGKQAALPDLQEAIKRNERCAPAHFFLGQVTKSAGDPAGALKHFKRTLELKPDHIDAAREVRMAATPGKK